MTTIINGSSPSITFSDNTTQTTAFTTTPTINTITSAASTALTLQSAGTTAVTIDTSQNVGISNTSPSTFGRFVVQDSGSGGGTITAISSTASNAIYIKNTGTEARFSYNDAYPMTFLTNSTERMRIDSSGNLLVGTTSALSDAGKINIVGQNCLTAKASTTPANFRFQNTSNTQVGYISWDATNTTYATSSDYRLKENIAPMTGALATVSALKPVTYKWKSDGSDGQGFIAHELQGIVPQCVIGEKDAIDADGNPQYQGIDTSFLVATLTAAIQELNAKVDAQAAEIQALKAKA